MTRGRIINGLIGLAIACLASGFVFSTATRAAQDVPVRAAVQTTIGPKDAPVRTAVLTQSDKQRVKVEPAGWGGYRGAYYGGYRGGFYAGYAPAYVYRRPYYVAPYAAYYPYASPYYYPAAPYYASSYYPYSYGPAFVYPTPRRVYYGSAPIFPAFGACYW